MLPFPFAKAAVPTGSASAFRDCVTKTHSERGAFFACQPATHVVGQALVCTAVTLAGQAAQSVVTVGQGCCRSSVKTDALRQQTPLGIVGVHTLQHIGAAAWLAVAFTLMREVAGEVVLHVGAAQAP